MEIPTVDIAQVYFGIMSPEEIKANAVVEITNEETFSNGQPVIGGLFDPKMGVIEFNEVCATCGKNSKNCPGHFGYIKLATPIYHPSYLDIIKKVIESICIQCSQLLLTKTQKDFILKTARHLRLDKVKETIKTKKYCAHCEFTQPSIKKQSNRIRFTYAFKTSTSKEENVMLPMTMRTIFEKINPRDAEVLGFTEYNRPEWMIFKYLPISPPVMRPTVVNDNNQRSEDDQTIYLVNIIKANKTLENKINSSDSTNQNQLHSYVESLNTYFSGMIIGNASQSSTSLAGRGLSTRNNNQPLKSIAMRISGKTGRIRKNLMGKRVDYSGRSVITPDPNLDIDQLGVPKFIAKILTFPERVHSKNKDQLYKYIVNARQNIYPMAVRIISNGSTRTIKYIKEDIILQEGDVVIRQLVDNDIALFNRQPTLHKMSMMAFKTKVLPGKTFRINLSVTTPFNADFDGDEMNLMFPQSLIAAQEIWELARAQTQIITPQTNGPIIGIVQDSLLGSYLMTSYNTVLTREMIMNILSINPYFTGKLPTIERKDGWFGNQLIETIIPRLNTQKFTNTYNENITDTSPAYEYNSKIVIKNGKILSGSIDKSILGSKKPNSFAHLLCNDFSIEHAKDFLSLIQKFTNLFLVYRGFSIGLGDVIPSNGLRDRMNKEIAKGIMEIDTLLTQIDENKFISPPDTTVEDFFEAQATALLNNITLNTASEAIKELDPEKNALMAMIKSGSKGEPLNIGQIMGCVGQQNVDRKRIMPTYGKGRTLPFFWKNDFSPKSRGFVEHSFLQGLDPVEFFLHSMTGREGIIDTSIKTADSGYISRRLMKAMEDLYVANDNTVRTANGLIIQYLYGNDGINPIKIEKQRIGTILMSDDEIKKMYKFESKNTTKEFLNINEKEVKQIFDDRNILREILLRVRSDDINDNVYLPVNLQRLIVNAKNYFGQNTKNKLSVKYIVDEVKKLIDNLPKQFTNTLRTDLEIQERYYNAVFLLSIAIRTQFASKRIINEYKMSKSSFDYLISQTLLKFNQAIVDPGEMVGTVASQSLGEPSTQLTLNTFHFSGVGSKSNVTAGVPRLNELINLSKKLDNPFLVINIKNPEDKHQAEIIKNQLRKTNLIEFVKSLKLIFDPSMTKSNYSEDAKWLNDFVKYSINPPSKDETFSNIVIRLVLNRKTMLYNHMTLDIIRRRINSLPEFYCASTDDNDPEIVIRVYTRVTVDNLNNVKLIMKNKDELLNKFVLRGINKITNVQVRKKTVKRFDKKTGAPNNVTQYFLDTDGSNLKRVLAHRDVDISKTYSTDIHEIYAVFGVEAARNALIKEINQVLDFNGIYVNYHHIALLADTMTMTGRLTSISRHGFNKLNKSPIAKASFEETIEQLKRAALYNDTDHMRSVSARIMFGQAIKGGTGFSQMVIDESAYGVSAADIDDIL